MHKLIIPTSEMYDERTSRFITIPGKEIQVEHSLVSISKWESKWKRPFISDKPMTREQTIDYIRCMTITQNVDPILYYAVSDANIKEIKDYIADPMTATTFRNTSGGRVNRQIITSEIVYYWMIDLGIPKEFEKWHFNRLMTLIRVCSEKSQGGKKMSRKDVISQYKALNQARRAKSGSKG